MKKINTLRISTPQGESGVLEHGARHVFNYTAKERACETSLLMPLRAESYASGVMPGPFTMNLPEGYLKEKIEQRLAKLGGVDPMRILAFIGGNQIGRLRFDVPAAEPAGPAGLANPAGRKVHIGRKDLLKQSSSPALFDFLLDAYLESGISGVQPKVMIPDADKLSERATLVHSDLIVKAGGDDYPHLAVNEFLCMSAAKQAGILVPQFWLSDDGGLFVMERFDLIGERRIGFEDMAVLMNKTQRIDDKYQSSYEAVAKAVTVYCDDAQRADSLGRLFEYVALSVMVRNGDAHLKNFGLLYEHPAADSGPTLAPLYDVVTTSAYDLTGRNGATMVDRTMALKMNRAKDYPGRKTLLEFGKQCNVKKPEQVIERLADAMQTTLQTHGGVAEPAFLARMTREWDGGRQSLAASRFVSVPYAGR
jgi:serine/threonine-protein kinase HipA